MSLGAKTGYKKMNGIGPDSRSKIQKLLIPEGNCLRFKIIFKITLQITELLENNNLL